ncbi:haloacid dehalogenase type II [Halobacteriales archaeon QS_4_70_19]|nr:MAG: haloacid dehalogenase type II [Halobacteriales archaeon QS_4_70_19]
MSFDPDRVDTLTFDSYSTVVDVDSAATALDEHLPEDVPSERLSNLWRAHSIMYTLVANHLDTYGTFYEYNRQALTHALETFGVDAAEQTRDEILAVYMDLDVFTDVESGMARLADAYDIYIVSNGDPAMLDAMVQVADIEASVEDTISADEVETYKPAATLYEHAAERAGTDIENVAHTSAGWFDVQGAAHAGMQGVWVNRDDDPWVRFDGEPDLEVVDLHALADALGV